MTAADELRQLADRLDHDADWLGAHDRDTPEVFVTDLRAAAVALRHHANLLDTEPVGVDYCTLHHGIHNEDEHSCDFRDDDQETGDDGEPRECVLVPLIPAAAVSPPPAPTCPTGCRYKPCPDPWHQETT